MKDSRIVMGMPVTVEVVDIQTSMSDIDSVFDYFKYVNDVFSVHKHDSEISCINRGEITPQSWSADMKEIFALAEDTRRVTGGYFDALRPDGLYDPSGIVKGWAIERAKKLLQARGLKHFCIEAGGDIALSGSNSSGAKWIVGIRNPFKLETIMKTIYGTDCGVATSGNYLRGNHVYNPKTKKHASEEVVSVTVIGPNVYEADRFATAAYAMGREGISFIEKMNGFEGYMIDNKGIATFTSGFEQYTYIK
jgi:thiamine biosynthesis lipoprotein